MSCGASHSWLQPGFRPAHLSRLESRGFRASTARERNEPIVIFFLDSDVRADCERARYRRVESRNVNYSGVGGSVALNESLLLGGARYSDTGNFDDAGRASRGRLSAW